VKWVTPTRRVLDISPLEGECAVKDYAMSTDTIQLTATQKIDFDRDGFVVLREFFSRYEVDEICQRIDRYICNVAPTLPPGEVMYEDKDNPATLKQLPHIAEHDDHFRDMLQLGKMVALAEMLLGHPVVGKELEWFNKVPNHSRETPPHQDGYYFMIEPQEALTMWIALDDVDEENGCLRYVRGSHLRQLRPHGRSEILGLILARPGDVLVHHSLTIHRAAPNSSMTRQRRSLGMIYYSSRAKQDVLRLEGYQRQLIDELKQSRKI
jgi:phytanoyl-CoA hydroxylase